LGALTSWAAMLVFTFFIGFGLGGNIPIDATIVMEFIPKVITIPAIKSFQTLNRHSRTVATSSPPSPSSNPSVRSHLKTRSPLAHPPPNLGVIICSLISWGLVPKYACETGLPSCHSVSPGGACCTKSSNYGWRYAVFCIGGISIAAFVARYIVLFTQD
jgi:MFS family permease